MCARKLHCKVSLFASEYRIDVFVVSDWQFSKVCGYKIGLRN